MKSYVTLLSACLLAACPAPEEPLPDDTDTDTDTDTDLYDDPIPLAGVWVDSFNGEHEIDDARWSMGDSAFHLSQVSADERWAVAQNDAENEWNPDLWSRFDWSPASEPAGWWVCQTAYDAVDEDAAVQSEPADATDPASSGCAGFAWSRLYTPLPLRGAWVDSFGGDHDIREWAWTMGESTYHVVDYDLEDRWIIAQNDSENAWNPGAWSRFDWTSDGEDFWFCQIAYAAETEQEARDTAPADPSSPDTAGCGGFAWSSLSPAR